MRKSGTTKKVSLNGHLKSVSRAARIMKRVLRKLVPTRMRLKWQRSKVNRIYRREILEASNKNDKDGLEYNHFFELGLIDDEEEDYVTRKLLKEARKYDVDIPSKPRLSDDNPETSELWVQSDAYGDFYLTSKGRSLIRNKIREEKKARHEQRARLVVWVNPLIGLVGVLCALLTLLFTTLKTSELAHAVFLTFLKKLNLL